MTKNELFSAMTINGVQQTAIRSCNGGLLAYGIVQSVQREDGSGHCFNVAVDEGRGVRTVFVRTID